MQGKSRPVQYQPHSGWHEALINAPPPHGSPVANWVRVEVVLPGSLRRLLLRHYSFAEGWNRGKIAVATGHEAYDVW